MDSNHGKPRLRLPARSSVLGDGLLERARSTTLALLGVTGAVGLAIVALAVNQSWPLLAGSPLPAPPGGDEAVGAASVVARAPAGGAPPSDAGRSPGRSPRRSASRPAGSPTPAGAIAGGPEQTGSSELVAASAPVSKPARKAPPRSAAPERPQPEASAPAAPAPQPSAAPRPSAQPVAPAPSGDEVEAPSPPATISSAPPEEESHVPAWSQGKGHAYGRSGRE